MSPEDTSFDSAPPNLVSRFFHSDQRPNSGRTPSCAEMWLPLDRIKYRRLRREIGALLSTILEPSSATGITTSIAAAIEEQGMATKEISRNVQQAAEGTVQVASNIAAVNRGASETGSASSQVLSSAKSLSNDSNRLKLEVSRFLNTVRAA